MADLKANIYSSTAITWVAASAALVMRIFARRITKIKWWYDDYFCILAFIFASLYSATILEWTIHWSLGQYMPDDIDPDARNEILYYSRFIGFFNSLTYAFSIAFSKLAILCLYWRVFKQSSIRIPILVMMALVTIWIIIRTFMVIFRCVPVQAYWDKSIPHAACRIGDTGFFFGTVFTHFLMDIAILIMPVVQLSKLGLPLGQKIAVTALFLVGVAVCLASIFAIVEALTYNPKSVQQPHDYGMYCIWGTVELNIAIVSACCPLLRPIFRHMFPARFFSSYGSSQSMSRPRRHMKLVTIHRTVKEPEVDETSSTHQLAVLEDGITRAPDFDTATDHGPKSVHTVISSLRHGESIDGAAGMSESLVQNDRVVRVQEIELGKMPKT